MDSYGTYIYKYLHNIYIYIYTYHHHIIIYKWPIEFDDLPFEHGDFSVRYGNGKNLTGSGFM